MIKYLILTLLITLGLNACTKSETAPDFNEPIDIRLSEIVDSTKRTLRLTCITQKIYSCINSGIQSTYTIKNDKLMINFISILPPNICLTATGPASTVIELDGLSNKEYEVELNLGVTKISGQLKVTPGSFNATLPAQSMVQFVNPDLQRIPDNTIYGTVHYHQASTAATVQAFIDTLQLYGASPTLYTPGDYQAFQIEPSGEIKQTQDAGYLFTRYYIFNYAGNSSVLKSLVSRFGINHPQDLRITLHTTKGETFRSNVH